MNGLKQIHLKSGDALIVLVSVSGHIIFLLLFLAISGAGVAQLVERAATQMVGRYLEFS